MSYGVETFSNMTSIDVLDAGLDRTTIQIGHIIRLIGTKRLYAVLFPWPEGLPTYEYAKPEHNFVQTTGTQDGLTVEWKLDGRLVALGHPTGSTELIDLAQKDDSTIAVHRNEVFSPDEAIALFTEYLTTDTIDTTHFSVREIAYGDDADDAAPETARGK
ncbi:hypothetical protein ACPXB3_14565 [Gordonia sp. DT219]|uniref:hypothetical protein n=1 Tax=Gordonia sp. DT219 TaxID=3416658 RepID=UPI003CF09889